MKLTSFIFALLPGLLSWQAHANEVHDKFHGDICAKDKKSSECLEAKNWIRRYHMDLLLQHRDQTLRFGVRYQGANNKPIYGSLRACISCHVKKDKQTGKYPRIKEQKHHCAGCHMKAAVRLDCFECHSSKPDKATIKRLGLDKR